MILSTVFTQEILFYWQVKILSLPYSAIICFSQDYFLAIREALVRQLAHHTQFW